MLVKLYGIAWAVTLTLTAVLYLTGQFSSLTLTVLGFIYFALLYGGIISVIPVTEFHGPSNQKH
jgi:hypothetical protein